MISFVAHHQAYCAILCATVVLVYALKAFRFYFLLVGEGVPLLKYLAVFARTTFVNIILPLKCGELYRFYAFGRLTQNYPKGFSIVLLDRFIDTASLLCMFVVLRFLGQFEFGRIFLLLSLACFFLVAAYLILPGMLSFWNVYFIESAPSKRHLRGLFLVRKVGGIYGEVRNLVKGRFFAIFALSLLSWLSEICSLLLCRRFFDLDSASVLSDYLVSALTGANFAPQRNFALASVAFLGAAYIILLVAGIFRRGVKHGR